MYVGRDTQSGRTVAIRSFCRRPSPVAPVMNIAPRSADFANAFATSLKGFFLREANLLAKFAIRHWLPYTGLRNRTVPPT